MTIVTAVIHAIQIFVGSILVGFDDRNVLCGSTNCVGAGNEVSRYSFAGFGLRSSHLAQHTGCGQFVNPDRRRPVECARS